MSASVDRSRVPAAAYAVMAAYLGSDYFTGPPPVEGVELEVRGRDGMTTWWAMGPDVAARVRLLVSADIRVSLDAVRPYSPEQEDHGL